MPAASLPAPARVAPARETLLAAALIVVAALLAYHNSFSGAFVFDDFDSVVENPTIRRLWPLSTVLAPPEEAGVGGRPLANLTLALNYAISGPAVWSYHALNLALHAGAALALFGVVRRALLQPALRGRFAGTALPLALIVAVLWAVHPVQTAAVDYVSQRTEVLLSLCYLLTLYGFLRSVENASRGWRGFTFAACAAGMASKEVMVTAPVLVLLLDRAFVAGSWSELWRARRGLHLALASTWVLLATLMLRSPVTERGVGYGLGVSWLTYLCSEARAIIVYLRTALWPHPLIFDHGWPFVTPDRALPYLLATGAIIALVLAAVWRGPRRAFPLAAFLLLLAPSSSVVPIIQQPVAESRLHLPLAGLIVSGVVLAHAALGRRLWPFAAVLAVAGITTTMRRNQDYADNLSLWSDTIVKLPRNARAHTNLAAALARAGRIDESALHAAAAVRLLPASPYAQTNLGAAWLQAGLAERALPHFEAAVRAAPRMAVARTNLADALLMLGRRDEAIPHYREAIALNPRHAKAHANLGVALQLSGKIEEAITSGRRAVELAPENPEAHYNLGNSLARGGRPAEAVSHFEIAVRLRPEFPSAHYSLGSLLLQSGRGRDAVPHLETALRLRPNYPEARAALERARGAAR